MMWKKVKLGELYEVHNGLSKARPFFGEGYPFLTFSTVFNNYFIPNQITDLVQSTKKEQESYSIHRGDVFVTRTSETSDELGMSCVALKDYPMATYNGFTKRMRPITDRVLPEYIGYYLRLPSFRGKFQAFSTMTTRASLRNEDLLGLEVELPPMEVQKQIAGVLSAYDALIENNQKQIKLLEEAAQRLYKEWFVDLHFPGHENTKMVDGVPEGWKISPIYGVFDVKYGKNLPTSKITKIGRYPVYGASGVIGYYNEKNCNDYTTLITSRGNGSGTVFRTHHKQSYVTNNSFIVRQIDESNSMGNEFVYQLFSSIDFKKLCTGSAQPQLTNSSMQQIKVLLPGKELIEAYRKYTVDMEKQREKAFKRLELLIQARNRLLPKIMNGEVEM